MEHVKDAPLIGVRERKSCGALARRTRVREELVFVNAFSVLPDLVTLAMNHLGNSSSCQMLQCSSLRI